MVTPQSIGASIEKGLACTHVEVRGDGQHFEAVVVSPAFAGLSRVKQHQLVYAALQGRMRNGKKKKGANKISRMRARPVKGRLCR